MNENERGSTEPPWTPSPFGSNAIRVFHVEADADCRETIAVQLAERGFVVRSCGDSKSLADGLVFREADILLLDWDMPGVSGIELLLELRRSGVTSPVVFLTSTPIGRTKNWPSSVVRLISSTRRVVWRYSPAASGSCQRLATLPPLRRPTS